MNLLALVYHAVKGVFPIWLNDKLLAVKFDMNLCQIIGRAGHERVKYLDRYRCVVGLQFGDQVSYRHFPGLSSAASLSQFSTTEVYL